MAKTTNLRVGFIGLGLMGNPMAKNILKAGFILSVYNRSKDKVKEFEKLGATVYPNPRQLAANVDIVITMVTGPKDVRQVCLGRNSIAEGAAKGLIVVDMSTIGPSAAQEIASDLKECGIGFVDAPVTGSVERAVAGTLFIFAGGDKKNIDKVMPVFEAMGERVSVMGPVGSGQAIKLVNNLIVGESLVALAEGVLLADSMGLPRKKVAEALDGVPAVSGMMKMKLANMVGDHFPTAFSMANMRKDLKLALGEIKKGTLPFLNLTDKFYKQGIDAGMADNDNSAILKVLSSLKKDS